MFSDWLLGVWSALGILWWLIAWRLVAVERARPVVPSSRNENGSGERLSIFKPLPPLGAEGMDSFVCGLESFVSQLDERSQLLLGVHEADRNAVASFLENMRRIYPHAQLQVVYRAEEDEFPNPKIAWQKILARHAEGELWLWSDADMVAPANFLKSAREEYAGTGTPVLTFPYVVKEVRSAAALLDALFVNAEFYPGVLLLRRRGPVDFGFGAGMLFRRDDFLRQVNWEELGGTLADDFVLGQKLRPVQISATTLVTSADSDGWRDALLHYLRWSKTVWWNRPAGSAARVIVLPVIGWAVAVGLHPSSPWTWAGLLLMMQVDVLFAGAICRSAGCRCGGREVPVLEGWTLWRVLVWAACWLPWPVVWRGRRWRGPRMPLAQINP